MALESDSELSSLLASEFSPPPSSPLSSLGERTPSPPPPDKCPLLYSFSYRQTAPYPSPPASQQTSQSCSPAPDGMASSAPTEKDGTPSAKRRKLSKERTTEHLDLRSSSIGLDEQQQQLLERLLNVLHKRQKIVVIAGAGISVSAGIPDFRSSQGLFRSLKDEYNLKGSGKHLFDASVYRDDVSTSSFHDMVSTMSRLTKEAKPTAFHHMLATIAQEDRLLRLYTQNVDGIDTSLEPLKTAVPLRKESDGKWPRTVQLHGGLDKMVCSKCHELSDLVAHLFTGPEPPPCPTCEEINSIRINVEGKRSHGIGRMRPRMVLYNEHNPDDEAIGAVTKEDLRKRPDAVIVVGTTLKVPGVRRIVREMCATVRDRRGGVTIWINNDPPPVGKDLEDCWDIIVHGRSDEVARHAAMRKWNDPIETDEFTEVNDEDAKRVAKKTLQVQLSHEAETIRHANPEPLPSGLHKNNSFLPPTRGDSTPRKLRNSGPEDWSPVTAHRPTGLSRSETYRNDIGTADVDAGESIDVALTRGLLTPSKSQRNSPTQKYLQKKQRNLTSDMYIASTKRLPASAEQTGTKKPKKTVKYIKKPLSQPKAQIKATAQKASKIKMANNTIAFKSSKTASLAAGSGKDAVSSPGLSPSKLRLVSNASSEPMAQLSPRHSRNNTAPTKCWSGQFKSSDLPLSENLS